MNTKICTSIEQSKNLLELRLNPNSADMYYSWVGTAYLLHAESYNEIIAWRKEYAKTHKHPSVQTSIIPAWSLTAILELMPIYIRTNNGGYNFSLVRGDGGAYTFSYTHGLKEPWELGYNLHLTTHENSVIDAAFEMVCWLIKQGHIKANR